jgi:hypothetical protein
LRDLYAEGLVVIFFLLTLLAIEGMVLSYGFYAETAPGLLGSDGDTSLSPGCGGRGAAKQSVQKFIPQVERTCVSTIFFSEENIEALQQGLRYMVYRESGGTIVIGKQSRDELSIIMRSCFLEHSRNLPFQLLEQVRDLNKRVLDYSVPRVVTEARANLKYQEDITNLPVPMARGAWTSRAGLRGGDN